MEARYTYIRLLLYRTFVTKAKHFDETQDATSSLYSSTISRRVFTECQILCVEVAQQLIGLLSDNLRASDADHREDLLPEWWYLLPCEIHKDVSPHLQADMFQMSTLLPWS